MVLKSSQGVKRVIITEITTYKNKLLLIFMSLPIPLFDDICSHFQSLDKRMYFTAEAAKHNNFNKEKVHLNQHLMEK